jgi:hypothetical protein
VLARQVMVVIVIVGICAVLSRVDGRATDPSCNRSN